MTTNAYRTLFVGMLRQTTAMSVGGRDLISVTDAPLCRDGQGRFTLRGQTLAGALIASARRLGELPLFISGDVSKDDRQTPSPSRWRSFASHPEGSPVTEIRQHVCIDAKTGTAKENGLFNLEVIPTGTCWPFLLEVDSSGEDGKQAEAIAWRTLQRWQRGYCYMGREVARGLGWMQLDQLQVLRLHVNQPEQVDAWPNAERSDNYPDYVKELVQRFGSVNKPELVLNDESAAAIWELPFTISVGTRDNGYGLDSLSIGGHAESEVMATWQNGHYLAPASIKPEKCAELFDPDFALVTTTLDGVRCPFIPGSALRGPLRHALERYYRTSGQWQDYELNLRQFFGAVDLDSNESCDPCSATLLVSDAHLVDDNWQAAWFQLHAEDEFTAGAYGSSKFDRLALINAKFTGRLVLETENEKEAENFKKLLEKLQELAKNGEIALGGGQWRGHGWVSWHFEALRYTGENR